MSYRPLTPTPRQEEILWKLAEGYSNRMVGDSLGMKPSTVKNHLDHLYRRIGVHTRAGAVAMALRNGWIV